MSTHKNLDRICVAIVAGSLVLTALFMNGESLGITKIVDEDAEQNSDSVYFTANDQDGSWDVTGATVITLTGDGASISGSGAYTVDGNVVISNAGYYEVSGTLTDGYISVDAYDSSKVFILLNGVEINCSDDACIRVDQADKVFLTLAEGSQNSITSGSSYNETALNDGTDGAVFAHDDLTINGSGSLAVNAQYMHGIAANDDLVITGGTITVTAAADAIHANDSLRIKEASIKADAGDDGLVTSNDVENGYFYLESGTLDITAADDAIHTTGDLTMAGGDVTIIAGDDGIHSDGGVTISGGTLLVKECYEGIEALTIDVSGGDVTIYPQDDGFNANGGSGDMFGGMGGGPGGGMGGGPGGGSGMGATGEGEMPTPPDMGSTGDGEMPTPPDMGSTGDGEMPTPPDMGTTGNGEMPTPPDMGSTGAGQMPSDTSTGQDGTQTSTDAADSETYIKISGGTIKIINETGTDADGLDSNGDILISGGTVYVSLVGTGSNSAVDYASESGGVAEISGGTIIACGASAMAEAFDSSSTQASILYNTSTTTEAGTTLAIEDADGKVLLSWDVPCSFSSALVSCPDMEVGGTYTVVIGENAEEITLSEVSASYGDAQSSMYDGNMNWGGMKNRGDRQGNRRGDSSNGSTDSETASEAENGHGRPGGMTGEGGGQTPPEMGQGGMTGEGGGQAPPEMSQSGETGEGGDQMPPDMSQGGMTGGPSMQDQQNQQNQGQPGQQEQTQAEEDAAAQDTVTAQPVDAKSGAVIGGSAALLAAAVAVVLLYKKH
ncbi:MAG: carbohydrate-binding domain-containing protein [Lachnospiraceae bacterium]|nr:carbohydrate-binding domain-containing protein [Lachnospiraceae bacterium]